GPNPKAGVILEGFPGGAIPLDSNGRYEVVVPYNWSGTVTPVLEGYEFRPPNKVFSPVKRNMKMDISYSVSKLMYEISGEVRVPAGPVSGVVMKGLPGNPKTNSNGRYSVKVDYNWTGTSTPTKDGYVFDPPIKVYDILEVSQTAEDFFGSVIQYTISGNVGLPDVQINGLPGNIVSDGTGYFMATVDHGASGKIVPMREGFEFTPPSLSFQKVTTDIESQDFEPKEIRIKIAGSVGLPQEGVLMQGLMDENGDTVLTDARGRYEATVPFGWYGEIMPISEGYTFSPASKMYENVTRNKTTETYKADKIKHVIKGRIMSDGSVDISGIVIGGLSGNIKTNPVGEFQAQVPYGWKGKIIPRKDGVSFDPPELEYYSVQQNLTDQDFMASVKTYSVTGRIRSAKGPVDGIHVMTGIGSDVEAYSDMEGFFELNVPHGWSGQVAFVDKGYEFNPPYISVSTVNRDQSVEISATAKTFKIEGEIIIGGDPVPGVTVTATNGGTMDMTDSLGQFTVEVPYNWSGELVPSKEGWQFDPPSKFYDAVTENINERANAPQLPPTMDDPAIPDDPFANS
ncbi:MAG: hypothetical protein MI922_13415, partial [Bacteroidales bacterium]|nr:hypothetical protein [Bacteroidales bacterium]